MTKDITPRPNSSTARSDPGGPSVTIPKSLTPPIDMRSAKKEAFVKDKIKKLLNLHGWFTWMPPANGHGAYGIADHAAIKNGVYLVVEAKFGNNKPTPMQRAFAAQIIANNGFAFCVNDTNIDWLAWWLESFEIATQCQTRGLDVPPEHGSRMLNAIQVLTEPFGAAQARIKPSV